MNLRIARNCVMSAVYIEHLPGWRLCATAGKTNYPGFPELVLHINSKNTRGRRYTRLSLWRYSLAFVRWFKEAVKMPTAIAASRTDRNFICVDIEEPYCDLAGKRLARENAQLRFDLLAREVQI